ncbi:MAG: hypothetical protein M1831_005487 [Alyxoria varia]|nr:MAG: hypothetical protein M1831_005487 [Alyxoria varia]
MSEDSIEDTTEDTAALLTKYKLITERLEMMSLTEKTRHERLRMAQILSAAHFDEITMLQKKTDNAGFQDRLKVLREKMANFIRQFYSLGRDLKENFRDELRDVVAEAGEKLGDEVMVAKILHLERYVTFDERNLKMLARDVKKLIAGDPRGPDVVEESESVGQERDSEDSLDEFGSVSG